MNVAHHFRSSSTVLLHRMLSTQVRASIRRIQTYQTPLTQNTWLALKQERSHESYWAFVCLNKYRTLPGTSIFFRANVLWQRRFISNANTNAHSKMQLTMNNVNKNVPENILIFSQENDSFYRFLSFFGVFQMILWGYLSLSPVQDLRTRPVIQKDNEIEVMPWWKRWLYKEGQYKNAISGIFLTVGASILFVSITYPQRAVKNLWLLKGGRHIQIVTHSLFKNSRTFSVPVDNVNCLQARTGTTSQIPLKIKNRAFFFLMDKQGIFHHPEMFDFVIGLKRNL